MLLELVCSVLCDTLDTASSIWIPHRMWIERYNNSYNGKKFAQNYKRQINICVTLPQINGLCVNACVHACTMLKCLTEQTMRVKREEWGQEECNHDILQVEHILHCTENSIYENDCEYIRVSMWWWWVHCILFKIIAMIMYESIYMDVYNSENIIIIKCFYYVIS